MIPVEYMQWFKGIKEIPCSERNWELFFWNMFIMTLDHKSRSRDVIVESNFAAHLLVRSKVLILRTWSCCLTNKFPTMHHVSQWWNYKVEHMHTVLLPVWRDTSGHLCLLIRRQNSYFLLFTQHTHLGCVLYTMIRNHVHFARWGSSHLLVLYYKPECLYTFEVKFDNV